MILILNGDRIAGAAASYSGPQATMAPPDGFDLARISDYRLIDGALVIPPPESVDATEAMVVLALQPATDGVSDSLLAQAEAAFAGLPEPDRTIAQIRFQRSTRISRSHPLIQTAKTLLGLTEAQIDDLFAAAAAAESIPEGE